MSPGRRDRLIPAHAGKTELPEPLTGQDPAHPRSRGENAAATALASTIQGSSPLTRGKPSRSGAGHLWRRLIPAHAGKTCPNPRPTRSRSAHPRSRGENRDGVLKSMSIGGSSPLTRGKQARAPRMRETPRLIPAHAGKTHPRRVRRRVRQAHPRSRGENVMFPPKS